MGDRDRAGPWQKLTRFDGMFKALLPSGRLTRNAMVASSGHVASYAVMLLVTPLLTRLYAPADFGIFAIYTSFISLITLASTLRYDLAIPLPSDNATAGRLVVLATGACCLISLVAALLIGVAGRSLFTWFKAEGLADYWLIFLVHLCAAGCYEAIAGWMVRRGTFVPLARARFAVGAVSAVVQVAAAFLVGGYGGIVIGAASGSVAGALGLAAGLRKERLPSGSLRPTDVWATARRYRRFPQYSVASSLVQKMTILLAPLALAALYQPNVVGWFALANRTLIVPLSLVGVPLARVYMSEASRLHRHGQGNLRRLFSQTLRKQLLFAGLPLGAVALFAPWVFGITFGANWREAGIYCSLLCPMLVLYVTNVVLATTLDVLERLELQLQRSLVSLACIAAGIALPKLLSMPPRMAILVLSLASSIGYLYTLWTTWRAIPEPSGGAPPSPHVFDARPHVALPVPTGDTYASGKALEVKPHA